IARVEEGDVPGCVPWRGDDLEAADAVTRPEEDAGQRLQRRPRARQLPLDDMLAGVDPRVELRHVHLDLVAEPFAQLVEGADVVAVPVRKRDPRDRPAGRRGSLDQVARAARQRRVDEREAALLAHEVRVDEPRACELDEVLGELTRAHAVPSLTVVRVPGERRLEQMTVRTASSVFLT